MHYALCIDLSFIYTPKTKNIAISGGKSSNFFAFKQIFHKKMVIDEVNWRKKQPLCYTTKKAHVEEFYVSKL